MRRFIVKNSREAVREAAKEIEGKKVRIKDITSKQNIVKTGSGILNARRRFRPNCHACLVETGYEKSEALPGYIDIYGSKLKMPRKLELCKTVVNGKHSAIELETEDGISFSIVLPEGCSGGLVTFGNGAELIPVAENYSNGVVPFIFRDPGIVPVEINVINLTAKHAASRVIIENSDAFWNRAGRKELPVDKMELETIVFDIGCDNCELTSNTLRFFFPPLFNKLEVGGYKTNKFSFDISFGDNYISGEPIKWIDVRKNGETVRYEVENGFRNFLYED